MKWSIEKSIQIKMLRDDAVLLRQEIGKVEADKPLLYEFITLLNEAVDQVDDSK